MLLVLFGIPGSGKSFIGKLLHEEFRFYHYEADDDLMPEIKEAILKNQAVSESLREAYFEKVCTRIASLKAIHPNLVVTQTFTKEKDRKQILHHFPEAKFIWVQADFSVIYSRLAKRKHLVRGSYGVFAKEQFEPPVISHWVLENNGEVDKIRDQLNRILDILDCQFYEP